MSITTPIIARELATALSAFGAEYSWLPKMSLDETATQKVVVIPISTPVNASISRSKGSREHIVNVGIMKRIKPDDVAALEAFDTNVTEAVVAAIRSTPLGGDAAGAVWKATEISTHALPDHLQQYAQLTAILSITYYSQVG